MTIESLASGAGAEGSKDLAVAPEPPNPYILAALDRWSGAFSRLLLPSGLGSKVVIQKCADEGAKVLSMGMYIGHRTAQVDLIPYDGRTYEGHTVKDESTGTLWAYETNLPNGVKPQAGEKFVVSLGHIAKCSDCRGHGRVRCNSCGGKIRWTEKNFNGDFVEKICSCGDGKMACRTCTGYGEMLKVLRVNTKYDFKEDKTKEYNGKLPEALLLNSSGEKVYAHVSDFETRAIAEAIDGFDAGEFDRLMGEARSVLRQEMSEKVAGKMVDPGILHRLVDGYFQALPNPVSSNVRLATEYIPIRMKCEVSEVPVKSVSYKYKDKVYSLYVYGVDGKVWPDSDQPSEFTWKLGVVVGIVIVIVAGFLLASIGGG